MKMTKRDMSGGLVVVGAIDVVEAQGHPKFCGKIDHAASDARRHFLPALVVRNVPLTDPDRLAKIALREAKPGSDLFNRGHGTTNTSSTLNQMKRGTCCENTSRTYPHAMSTSKRSKIEAVHLEEAARLKEIYDEKMTGPAKLSQLAFGQQYEIGSQGMVWQYLNGKSALNLDAALKFAKGLGCSVGDFSPRLAKSLDSAHAQLSGLTPPPIRYVPGGLRLFDELPPHKVDEQSGRYQLETVTVRVFEAKASMGNGNAQPDHDTVVDHIRLARQWVRTHLPSISSAESLAVLSAYGDSMSPTFSDGDILLVDRGVQDIRIDAVYVLSLNDELFIKRIQRRITDGAIIIKSDNPLYDPVVVDNGDRTRLSVLGRVVWAWNGRKL